MPSRQAACWGDRRSGRGESPFWTFWGCTILSIGSSIVPCPLTIFLQQYQVWRLCWHRSLKVQLSHSTLWRLKCLWSNTSSCKHKTSQLSTILAHIHSNQENRTGQGRAKKSPINIWQCLDTEQSYLMLFLFVFTATKRLSQHCSEHKVPTLAVAGKHNELGNQGHNQHHMLSIRTWAELLTLCMCNR